MAALLQAGERVKATFTNRRGDTKVFHGHVAEDELQWFDYIVVVWDDEQRMSDHQIDRSKLTRELE